MKRYDFFNPLIVIIAILAFLAMGYVGSFNYRFEDPLDLEVILTVVFACVIFAVGYLTVRYKVDFEFEETSIFSERLLLALAVIALVLQAINMILLGGIPLFNSTLKASATTNIWRVAYPLFLITLNFLLAKYYDRKYLILIVLGALIFGLKIISAVTNASLNFGLMRRRHFSASTRLRKSPARSLK